MSKCKEPKQIVFISNPFGFGPAAKLYPVIQLFNQRYKHELIFLSGDLSKQIMYASNVSSISVDERSVDSIKRSLEKFENPFVISSLNRFAVIASNELNIPNAFIDGLTWMWEEIPKEYLLTDSYYALNFIGLDKKINNYPQIIKTPYILDESGLLTTRTHARIITIHIGGFKNPLHTLGTGYLELLSAGLESYEGDKEIIVTGGSDALKTLNIMTKNKRVRFKTLSKPEFQKLLISCDKLITTSGLTTTLEAFYAGIPTLHLLPSNLSQYKILELLKEKGLADHFMDWNNYRKIHENIIKLDERQALELLDHVAEEINCSQKLKHLFIENFVKLIDKQPNTKAQSEFVNSLGTNGAEFIVNDLENKWQLAK